MSLVSISVAQMSTLIVGAVLVGVIIGFSLASFLIVGRSGGFDDSEMGVTLSQRDPEMQITATEKELTGPELAMKIKLDIQDGIARNRSYGHVIADTLTSCEDVLRNA